MGSDFFKIKNLICFFVSLWEGASVAIIRQLCFLSTMWVLGINSGHQAWQNMALHAESSRSLRVFNFLSFPY